MGSFYTLCSITNQTIVDGQELMVQFMIPRKTPEDSGGLLVKMFIESTKKNGVDEAVKSWEQSTKNWGNRMEHKGMEVSNDGATSDYIPFGPAIRGKYNDCGDVVPCDDGETQKRVKLMEGIFCGIPFSSLMDLSTDDRWYTYGMNDDDKMWKLKGVDDKLPSFILDLCKTLTVTYIHAPVYDALVDPEFSPEGRKDSYEKKWQEEYIENIRKGVASIIKVGEGDREDEEFSEKLILTYRRSKIYFLERMSEKFSLTLFASCLREGTDFEWLIETSRFLSSMSGMCFKLQRSQYGSQHFNWEGWKKIIGSLEPSIAEMKSHYGYDEDEDEDDI